MKIIFLSLITTLSIHAYTDMPTSSEWAKAMTSMACKIDFPDSYYGRIEAAGDSVIYDVRDSSGEIVASAEADSTFILAKKKCIDYSSSTLSK